MMLQPNEPISVVLSAAQWNTIMQTMAEAPVPHRIVDPLIRGIQQQCMQAARQQPELGVVHPFDDHAA